MKRLTKGLFIFITTLALVGCGFKVKIPVKSVELDEETLSLNVGDNHQLNVTVNPENATNKDVTWTSDNETVLSIDSKGYVSALSKGTAEVTVTSVSDTTIFDSCLITVHESGPIEVTSVTVSPANASILVGQTVSLSATVLPSNVENKDITWSTSKSTVATVSSDGVVTAKKAGTVTIKATSVSKPTVYGSCSVTVSNTPVDVTSVSISPSSLSIKVGGSSTLTASVLPSNAFNKNVTWSSSDTSVATVSDGTVFALKEGTTTIKATSVSNPTIFGSCNVTVSEGDKAAWTVMIYMCGSDLESAYEQGYGYLYLASMDLKEILSVSGQPDDINIIVQTGGAYKWDPSLGISSKISQRYHISNKSLVKDADLSDLNMGASSTFKGFLEWGTSSYPADKTAVIMWNHGGAMSGVCFDEKHNDNLMASEVESALTSFYKTSGRTEKLEWIGYDACLMQVQDIAEKNCPFFNYMIASQESESGYGWDYDKWVDDLYAKKDTEVILKEICDTFIKDNDGTGYMNDQTLSYLDLSKIDAYKEAWEDMAVVLKSKINSSNKSTFNNLVKSAKYFAGEDYDYFGVFDVKDFVNKLSNNSTFNPGTTYTTAVLDAFNDLVKYSAKGSSAGNANGLSLFWAISDNCYADEVYTDDETNFTNWKYLSDTYGK